MRWSFTQKNRVKPMAGGQSGKNLRIASPCSAKWEEMKGTDWMRHCTECNLNVYNFSEMTWKEVERLVASRQGGLCARFYRRADGTMLTQDCPKGLRAVVRRVSRWAGAALSAITVISSAEAQPRSWSEHIEQAQAESGAAAGSSAQGDASVSVHTPTVRATGSNPYFTQVDAWQPGEINFEATLPAKHTSGLVDIDEKRRDSAAQESGSEIAFR